MTATTAKAGTPAPAEQAFQPIRQYYDRANPDLLARIPLTATKVLELGCGAGALGAAFARRAPQAQYYGLELDKKAAAIAAERLHRVELFNADSDAIPQTIRNAAPFDAIIFGDVLEHLRDPWTALKAFAELLAEDGVLLICIPNVSNWHLLQRLLTGTFDYEDEGLFDRTHLRWFTAKTLLDMVREAGLIPLELRGRDMLIQGYEAFEAQMLPALKAMNIPLEQFRQRARPLQHIVKAVKQRSKQPMLVQSMMLRPIGGVNDVRIGRPLQAMESLPDITTTAEVRTMKPRQWPADKPKIFIWHRPVHQHQEAASILRIVERGYVVVTEFDDHTMRWPAIEQNEYLTLTGCHGVQTTTEMLAGLFREHQPEIGIFPNTMLELPGRRNFTRDQHMTVFFGALNREEDWGPVMPGINRGLAELAKSGKGGLLHFDVIHDRGFFEALETEHKSFTPTCEYPEYLDHMSKAEIALLPLADNLFNRCKSDLKFVEAGACGCAVLASPTVYEHSLKDGETGILVREADGFGTALMELAQSPARARQLGDQARAYVAAERMTGQQIKARRDWYQKLWDSRHETTPKLVEHLKVHLAKA
jgi:SAM-dependent methyltransferase